MIRSKPYIDRDGEPDGGWFSRWALVRGRVFVEFFSGCGPFHPHLIEVGGVTAFALECSGWQ